MYITLDIGGTNTRIGISSTLDDFIHIEKFPTPKTFDELKSKIKDTLKDIKPTNIAVGIAGFIERHEKKILISPHIKYLNDKKITEILDFQENIIFLENDASLAGLAEAVRGEGRGFSRSAYITISTGVGGVLIINNKIPDTNVNYEPGHHLIPGTGIDDQQIKSWEDYSSGTSFKKIYGVNPQDYDDSKIWAEYGYNLAIGLSNISLLWRPDVIVLGGSVSKKAHLFIETTNLELSKFLHCCVPEIKISQLGDDNGLIGGLVLLRQNIT